jgi:hypothetical protein
VSARKAHPLPRMLKLSAVFAAAVRDHVISHLHVKTWMRRTFAAVALGAKLAFVER